jgi:endonuclease/exonuclease/phosphatase family metal-dependent hydrolase
VRLALALAALLLVGRCACHRDAPPLRFATFNIENFPKDQRQIDGAFAEIARLDAGFIAVQEIYDPDTFRRASEQHLGKRWEFVTPAIDEPASHLGVLIDRDVWTALSSVVHDETRLGAAHKGTLEVRLRSTSGEIARVLVVHLKAGGDGREIRARQYVALDGIVRTAQRSGERVVLLGDFNATSDADRGGLQALASRTGLTWATEPLACSAFWDREDGCYRSRLDHVLTWARPASVMAAGACATHGCDAEPSCPRYAHDVSDHCPVVVTIN